MAAADICEGAPVEVPLAASVPDTTESGMSTGTELACKVVGKVGLNIMLPGSAAIIDLVEAAYHFEKKEYASAGVCVAFGALNLISLGLVDVIVSVVDPVGQAPPVTVPPAPVVNDWVSYVATLFPSQITTVATTDNTAIIHAVATGVATTASVVAEEVTQTALVEASKTERMKGEEQISAIEAKREYSLYPAAPQLAQVFAAVGKPRLTGN
eukprot:TRINITY_DN33691_c0_g1_i1.p1 TRINITY_DN33691_c0_g1~~TRINITY_DN33691_c0_g1_i1.p1  ORF type:complete len:238 (+),score=36.41 TRINITY_DN33691_c0_g1_i1:81-716(+)